MGMNDGHFAEPTDDGRANHLPGMRVPPIRLVDATGDLHVLGEVDSRWLVLYVYPRTGGPGIELPDDWDLIPGARGCTPQACSFRDHAADLANMGATVWGLSAQPATEQREFQERMHIPFPLLNDSDLELSRQPVNLPTFDGGDLTLYKRITLLISEATIRKVFYPVFPPAENAAQVIGYLTDSEHEVS